MDVNMSGLAAREISLNKANTGQDILLKTLEKTEEGKQKQTPGAPRPVERVDSDKQGRIDLYA